MSNNSVDFGDPFAGVYNAPATVLTVNTSELLDLYNEATTVQDSIIASLKKINDTLSALQLSWVGSSASEAKQLGDWWNKAMVNLFGTKADPTWGTLSRLLMALNMTSVNYSQTEAALGTMWNNIATSLESSWQASFHPKASKHPTTPAGNTNPPIMETFPGGVPKKPQNLTPKPKLTPHTHLPNPLILPPVSKHPGA